jgi:hypothetical protein
VVEGVFSLVGGLNKDLQIVEHLGLTHKIGKPQRTQRTIDVLFLRGKVFSVWI